MSYQLTEEQKKALLHFTINRLSDFLDEELSSEYLLSDDLVEHDKWDEINERKQAAIVFIINNL
jgi:hypothetical protein